MLVLDLVQELAVWKKAVAFSDRNQKNWTLLLTSY